MFISAGAVAVSERAGSTLNRLRGWARALAAVFSGRGPAARAASAFRDPSALAPLDLMRDPIWVYDPDARAIWWANAAALSFFGAASLGALTARRFSDGSDADAGFLRLMRRAAGGGVVEAVGAAMLAALEGEGGDSGQQAVDAAGLRALARDQAQLRAALIHMAEVNERLARLATTDDLTGLFNRRHFMERCAFEMQRVRRQEMACCVLMLDLDHFKRVNDTWGHAAGDDVLRNLADQLRSCVRAVDIIGRMGGEEFAICLPNTARERGAEVAERIRSQVEASEVHSGVTTIRVTVSIGLAATGPDADADAEALLKAADRALYVSKAKGRNRVTIAEA